MTALLLTALACHPGPLRSPHGGLDNPEQATVDLLRSSPGGEKIYVQARLPDGGLGLFLVDTGAGISAIHGALAERLGLSPTDAGRTVQGLGGSAPWLEATLPWAEVGGFVVEQIEVAVDVPGLPEYAGWMPLDGILGNNFWREAVLAVDYPADQLTLYRPDAPPALEPSAPMLFDGNHASTRITLHAGPDGQPAVVKEVLLELDTGAHGLMLAGATGLGLEGVSHLGEEAILGLGGSELMPISAYNRPTRRVPLQAVELGGARVESPGQATWINPDQGGTGGYELPGLIGHSVLSHGRAVFDYGGGRFALLPSAGPARELDGHRVLLEAELDRSARDPDRALARARLRLPLEEWDAAAEDLDLWLKKHPGDPEGVALRALVHRLQGQPEAALALLATLSTADLLAQGELLGLVNGLVLEGRAPEALALAERAVAEHPEEGEALLVLSDARLATGDPSGARRALLQAGRLVENPDVELKRRAHIALAEGDRVAALAHLRRRILLYPSDGEAMWFYAQLVATGSAAERGTFSADLAVARARLHDDAVPWDFLAAALRLIQAPPEQVTEALERGVARDCADMDKPPERKNCEAWYLGMAGRDLDHALALITEALDGDPHRADFLDTLAVIEEERGALDQAVAAALQAARLGPDRFYMLWQLERLRALAAVRPAE